MRAEREQRADEVQSLDLADLEQEPSAAQPLPNAQAKQDVGPRAEPNAAPAEAVAAASSSSDSESDRDGAASPDEASRARRSTLSRPSPAIASAAAEAPSTR